VADGSNRTVLVALGANLGVAVAKLLAASITGSTAMAAEAAHALADAGNQVLLWVAQRRSSRAPDERHPFGYGREAYFWALLASLGVFLAGALFSLREGIAELLDQTAATSFPVAYGVLAVAAVLDSISLVQAVRQLRTEAGELQRRFVDQLLMTSDPTVRAVFAEDAAAICGDVVAFVGVAVHQASGSAVPDGIAAVVIGLLVAAVGVQLARRNRDFLVGEPASAAARADVASVIAGHAGVVGIDELAVTFLGPRELWVLARVDVDDELAGNEVETLVRGLEDELRARSPFIARVDVVPIGPRAGRSSAG
jgi:cation diffusion facilitator family transporter